MKAKNKRTPKKKPAPAAGKGMTQSEFGKHIDCSQQRVQQMIASETISVMANGRIDPDVARIEYVRLIRRSPASEEVRRVAAARARHIEIQNEKELGKLISLEEVDFAIAEIIAVFCGELHGMAAGCTRDLALREVIQDYVNDTVNRCKARFQALADDARAGRPLDREDDDDEAGDD